MPSSTTVHDGECVVARSVRDTGPHSVATSDLGHWHGLHMTLALCPITKPPSTGIAPGDDSGDFVSDESVIAWQRRVPMSRRLGQAPGTTKGSESTLLRTTPRPLEHNQTNGADALGELTAGAV
jgi:hypothetical protein